MASWLVLASFWMKFPCKVLTVDQVWPQSNEA